VLCDLWRSEKFEVIFVHAKPKVKILYFLGTNFVSENLGIKHLLEDDLYILLLGLIFIIVICKADSRRMLFQDVNYLLLSSPNSVMYREGSPTISCISGTFL